MAKPNGHAPVAKPRRRARIVIVGSINMDLVVQVPRLPKPGETLSGSAFRTLPGGKGANQAVAIARLGGHATIIGCVGDDVFGSHLRQGLRSEGVDIRHVAVIPRSSSGVAVIGVEASGQNSIAIAAGANDRLRPADLRKLESVIASADALLLQLEIPLDTAAAAIRIARRHQVPTVLDCAPVPPDGLPDGFREIDILSPNQSEATLLTGMPCHTASEAAAIANALIRRYDPGVVVVKMGELGAVAHAGIGEPLCSPAFAIDVVDTTAAGDAFTAALTLRLAEGANLGVAMPFACAAGALAATRLGAQNSMPKRSEVNRFLKRSTAPSPR
jgi:ribokinase